MAQNPQDQSWWFKTGNDHTCSPQLVPDHFSSKQDLDSFNMMFPADLRWLTFEACWWLPLYTFRLIVNRKDLETVPTLGLHTCLDSQHFPNIFPKVSRHAIFLHIWYLCLDIILIPVMLGCSRDISLRHPPRSPWSTESTVAPHEPRSPRDPRDPRAAGLGLKQPGLLLGLRLRRLRPAAEVTEVTGGEERQGMPLAGVNNSSWW